MESLEFPGFSLDVDEVLNPPFVEDLIRQAQSEQATLRNRADSMAAKLRELGVDPDAL